MSVVAVGELGFAPAERAVERDFDDQRLGGIGSSWLRAALLVMGPDPISLADPPAKPHAAD